MVGVYRYLLLKNLFLSGIRLNYTHFVIIIQYVLGGKKKILTKKRRLQNALTEKKYL